MSHKFVRRTFRFLGFSLFVAAASVGYFFGRTIVPQLEQAFAGEFDGFRVFVTVSSCFLGIPALTWVGYKMMSLLSFSPGWLTYVSLPLTASLVLLYEVKPVAAMDEMMTAWVVYIILFFFIRWVLIQTHTLWYTPFSHDDPRHVGTIELRPSAAYKKFLRWVLFFIVLVMLLVAHPSDIATSTRMLLSPLAEFWKYIAGLLV